MSEYIKTDVGEYLTGRTGSFEKSPPDELWKHIEEKIPTYSAFSSNRTLLKYLIGGISLSGIIIAIILIYNQPISLSGNKTTLSDIKKSVATENSVSNTDQTTKSGNSFITSVEKTENVSAKTDVKSAENQNKKENKNSTNANLISDKSVTYSINASGLKKVTSISFVNDKNETVLVSKNPVPNSFGFYIIDISQLPKGTYSIMIATPEGSKLHKQETFK